MISTEQFITQLFECVDDTMLYSYCAWFVQYEYVYASLRFRKLINVDEHIIHPSEFMKAMNNKFDNFMNNIKLQNNRYTEFIDKYNIWLLVIFNPKYNLYIISAKNDYLTYSDAMLILDSLPCSVWIQGSKNNIRYCNKMYAESLNYTKLDVIKNNYNLINKKSSQNSASDVYSGVKKYNENIVVNGQMTHLEVTEIRNNDRLICTATDITEKQRNLDLYRNYKNNIEVILHNISTPIVVFDSNMCLMFNNHASKTLFNIDPTQTIIGYKLLDLVNIVADKFAIPSGYTTSKIKTYISEMCEFMNTLLDQHNIVAQLNDGRNMNIGIYPLQDIGTMLIFEDISEKVALKQELYDINQSSLQIIEYLNEGILVFGMDNRIKLINTKTKKIFNKSIEKDYINEHINNFFDMICENDNECLRVTSEILNVSYKRAQKYGQLPIGENIKIDYQYIPLIDGMHLLKFF